MPLVLENVQCLKNEDASLNPAQDNEFFVVLNKMTVEIVTSIYAVLI